jgi:uncharacterized SAM-binding protein YcdF (DUF218 family)
MNGLLTLLGIESWKPVMSLLVLPPVPLFLLLLLGARLILPRRGLGWFVILLSITLMWLSSCLGTARLLNQHMLKAPPALSAQALDELKALKNKDKEGVAIVILGGGQETLAPEYGVSNLTANSMERLRYGLWLSRATGIPVAFSGGAGWVSPEGQAEAHIAARIASGEFGQQIKWIEDQSRDTRENALRTAILLKPLGIHRVVLVTHGWHMPRARSNFQQAFGDEATIQAAPVGAGVLHTSSLWQDWLPTSVGFINVRHALHEGLGRLLGM